jgi:hypothetical protein
MHRGIRSAYNISVGKIQAVDIAVDGIVMLERILSNRV